MSRTKPPMSLSHVMAWDVGLTLVGQRRSSSRKSAFRYSVTGVSDSCVRSIHSLSLQRSFSSGFLFRLVGHIQQFLFDLVQPLLLFGRQRLRIDGYIALQLGRSSYPRDVFALDKHP